MLKFIPAKDEIEWSEILSKFKEGNFLQSWQWFEAHKLLNLTVLREIVIDNQGNAIGLIGGIIRNAKRARYLEIPGGPLIDWSNTDFKTDVVKELERIGRENNCAFVRIRPQLFDSSDVEKDFLRLGFKKAPMHLHAEHTSIIDISPSADTLLGNMRQQTRYEIKRASKREIVVRNESSEHIIETFYRLQQDTARRQNFIPPSHKLLRAYQTAFGDNLQVYSAWQNNALLNLGLVIFYNGEADYFEAASTPEARREPGAYAIIWKSINDAKDRNISRYNLWGIAPNDDPNHRYHGVTTFKRGFGGEDTTYLPAQDLVLSPPRYKFSKLVETLRRKRRKL